MLIGIAGRKRAGKDTFASVLVEEYGFTRFAFADVMKDFALALDPVIHFAGKTPVRLAEIVELLGWEEAKAFPEVRRTLQRLGTEAGREVFGPDFWVERTAATIAASRANHVVITDVRFPNEAEWVRAQPGTLLRVVRLGQAVSTDPHPSEHALDDVEADVTVAAADRAELLERAQNLAIRLSL